MLCNVSHRYDSNDWRYIEGFKEPKPREIEKLKDDSKRTLWRDDRNMLKIGLLVTAVLTPIDILLIRAAAITPLDQDASGWVVLAIMTSFIILLTSVIFVIPEVPKVLKNFKINHAKPPSTVTISGDIRWMKLKESLGQNASEHLAESLKASSALSRELDPMVAAYFKRTAELAELHESDLSTEAKVKIKNSIASIADETAESINARFALHDEEAARRQHEAEESAAAKKARETYELEQRVDIAIKIAESKIA